MRQKLRNVGADAGGAVARDRAPQRHGPGRVPGRAGHRPGDRGRRARAAAAPGRGVPGAGTRFPPFDDPPPGTCCASPPRGWAASGPGRPDADRCVGEIGALRGPSGAGEVQLATIVAASAIRWSSPRAVPSLPAVRAGPRRPVRPARRLPGPPRPWRRRGGRPSRVRARSASTWRYMTESARLSYGARRWMAISSGKSSGQARNDMDAIRSGKAAAGSSSEADVARTADARTSATRAARAPSS